MGGQRPQGGGDGGSQLLKGKLNRGTVGERLSAGRWSGSCSGGEAGVVAGGSGAR